nr:MAG TPA: Major capsid protein [Microviridae sp.]
MICLPMIYQMAVVRTLGKNTLGDNNKMKVAMRDYDMSTHDISTIFRSSIGVGMLVPFCKILCQKGDIIDLNLINKTLSQPTLGPLFGSFKLQHFMFFGGFRLYNSWLHNNRTGIGMKMSDIKLPMMRAKAFGTATDAKTNISASALYKYLGWTKSRRTGKDATVGMLKNGVPLLMYLDIFKNFFANTQEDKFYMLKGVGEISFKVTNSYNNVNDGPFIVGKDNTKTIKITNKTNLEANITTNDYQSFWNSLNVKVLNSKGTVITTSLSQMTSDATKKTITLDNIDANPFATILLVSTTAEAKKFLKTELGQYDLKVLDQIRDVVLHKKGNTTLILEGIELNAMNNGSEDLVNFFNDVINSQANKLGGMLLKTYDSDIFNNWIKTDWIDGKGGITEITSIDIAANDGKLTMDALNLQQKVYNMLNRIAVAGGTYRDWLETVYTAGKYLDRPETPVFIGGMTQYIEFDEVISKSATETTYGSQPLGDIAAIGRGGKPLNNGHIHYQCEEPGYIMGLMAITPMIDYSQGNDFDLNLQTIDDLHKPALDGIGYQDLIQEQMVGVTSTYEGGSYIYDMKHLAANKTVAWIDYMTNYNRTFGDFAAGEALDFMVLNRRYEVGDDNTIKDLTTYIDPQKYIEIFADTSIDSQNFWAQTVVQATRRGNYSAKQIPFL